MRKLIRRAYEGEVLTGNLIVWKWYKSHHGIHFVLSLFSFFAIKVTRWDGHWFFEVIRFGKHV